MGIASTQPRARVIKSIQRGTITITSATSNTATLSPAVDTTRTELRVLGQTSSADDRTYSARTVLTDGTTVTATRVNSGSATTVVSFEITEYY